MSDLGGRKSLRVFVSSTYSDLEVHRDEVIMAIRRLGHTPVVMEDSTAENTDALSKSLKSVASCDIYVGIFAWMYGYIPNGYGQSLTELEYREAEKHDIPTLISILDESHPWPRKNMDADMERIDNLRKELQESKIVSIFTTAEDLGSKMSAAIANAVDEIRERLSKHKVLNRECVAGSIPGATIQHFQGRENELRKLHQYLKDESLRMVLVCGRGGFGKTSLVTKFVSDVKDNLRHYGISGIVFISLRQSEFRSPDKIVELIFSTLSDEAAKEYRISWQNKTSLNDGLELLFGRVLINHSCLIVMDNLESVIDETNSIPDEFLGIRLFIEACLEYDHAALIIATSRKTLVLSPEVEGRVVERRVELPLDKGISVSEAAELLRRLDYSGGLGLREADNELLVDIATRCECIPRTIEILVGTLLQRRTWTINALLSNDSLFCRLIENPARELYESLDSENDKLVVYALAIYDKPVSSTAIRHVFPSLPIDDILDGLVRNYVVSYNSEEFSLHALDQQYIYHCIHDTEGDYSKIKLHNKAAGYFRKIRKAVDEWKSYVDIESQIHEIHHLIKSRNFDSACEILNAIDREYLAVWDYYPLIISIREQLLGNIVDRELEELNYGNLGCAYLETGHPEKGLEYYKRALSIAGENGNQKGICRWLGNIGVVHIGFKKYVDARNYLEEAIDIARSTRDRRHEGRWLGKLAEINVMTNKTLIQESIESYNKAIEIAKEEDDKRFENIWLLSLGNLYLDQKKIDVAIDYYVKAANVAESNYDLSGKFINLMQAGECHNLLEQYGDQKRYYTEALEIAKKVESTQTEIELLISLGALCYSMKDGRQAIAHYQDALVLAEKIGDTKQQAFATFNIADAFHVIGELENASNYYKKSLNFDLSLINHRCECALGTIYMQKNENDLACFHYNRCLDICKEILKESKYLRPVNIYAVIANLGLGEAEAGLAALREGIQLCSSIGDFNYALQDLYVLKRVSQKIGGLEDAINLLKEKRKALNLPTGNE